MNIFNQRFPCTTSWKSHLVAGLFFGLFVMGFLLAFKPFGLNTLESGKLLFYCAVYGFIAFACIMLIALSLPKIFPSFFNEETWTTGKQILLVSLIVIVIGLVNYFTSPLMGGSNQSLRKLLWYQGITIMIALLPITIFTLLKQNLLLKKFEKQAASLEKKLQQKLDPDKEEEPPAPPTEKKNDLSAIELTGDYQGEKIILLPEELCFISAANNYVKVYFIKKDKVAYSILRMTMKKVEEVLQAWPGFFRCHRAYIINLDKVQHVEGNAQGYKVRLAGVEEAIPVSRNLNSEFSDRLLAMRNTIV
jgi:DNA-binding LytR/AlgR family response regulator